ncbi:sensor domain-containing diguanylate cyclase [Mariprofundus ferrooxydans]|uniref:Sensory box/GGDEF family protein n=1 Tax=Mariprofundus ferrooxydans PV-1 TaxID=314345 RepID=Q0F0P8_9PROT|nr:sensor domain-containing diguanylate cyclase [Mariprofundus ferrooxydans]EAU54980.1 sensory box/GGDEF family protein [Mariprofundus ferrooxydans PV-1]KON48475.1 diguanylate cyclase [Mariprofundus ferrooxydans]
MVDRWTSKYSIEDKRLSDQFRVFAMLLLLTPTAVFLYIASNMSSLSELFQAQYIVPYLFSLIITLGVLALLQNMFSKLSMISSAMMEGGEHALGELNELQGAYELRGIVGSFGTMLEQYKQASSDLQRRALELLLIKELSAEASSNLDMHMLLSILLDKIMQVNKANIGSVFLVDEEGENFHIICSRGLAGQDIVGSKVAIKDSISRFVIDGSTTSLLVDDVETDERTRKKNDPKYGSPSFLSLPVRAGNKLVAVLNLAHKDNDESFHQDDVDLAAIMIHEVGFAIENARIHSEIKDHVERLEQQSAVMMEEIRRRKLAEKELEHLAHRDTLTGVSNRYMFLDRLEMAVAHAQRRKAKLAVMFVDLDRFKFINDTYGHAAGDAVLRSVATRMSACLREVDLIARYGGDEFTVTLVDVTSTEGIALVARKIIDTLQQPIRVDGTELNIGCSIGISLYPDDSADFEELIRNADEAMYVAKQKPESGFHFFQPTESIKTD